MATMNINSPLAPFTFKGDIMTPSANINPNLVNVDNSSYSGGFGSNETSRNFPSVLNKLPISNVEAAAASKIQSGGKTRKNKNLFKLKIKNIVNKYKKMKSKFSKKMTLKKMKRRLSKMFGMKKSRHAKHSRKHRGSRKMKMRGGGYHQYMGNVPNTPVYSTGGVLPPSQLALANPVPFEVLKNTGACTDNYNHYTNSGKQIW
jgi:hypothetical protein